MGSNCNHCIFLLIIGSWFLTQGLASYFLAKSQKYKMQKSILAAAEQTHKYYITQVESESTKILGENKMELIDKLLSQPRAMLTWNDTSEPCGHIIFKNVRECIELEKFVKRCGAWNFVNSFGTCVRLFEDKHCFGESIAVYPGSNFSLSIVSPYYKITYSIGPCFQTEFTTAGFYRTSELGLLARKDLSNPRTIPDLLNTKVDLKLYQYAYGYDYDSLAIYLTKREERVKFIWALTTPRDLPRRPTLNISYWENSPAWSRMDKREGDRLGFILPTSLYGPKHYTYNIFPQGKEHFRKWKEVTDALVTYLQGHADSWFRLYALLDYYNETEAYSRPWRTFYYAQFGSLKGQEAFSKYDFILNE